MSKSAKTIIGLIIIVVIAAILVAVFHKSPYKTNSSTASNNNTSQKSQATPVNNSIVLTKSSPTLGQYLTDPSGRALYTYNADTANTSNCTGSCLSNWPPYVVTSTSNLPSGITTFKRSDNGAMQYAYNGMPLYYFASDTNGQATGNGVENFKLATPSTASSTNSSSSNSSTNSSSSGYPY